MFTIMLTYNHIGWVTCFSFASIIYLVNQNTLFHITETQCLDVAVTKTQFPAFLWLPVRSGPAAHVKSHIYLYLHKDSSLLIAWESFLLLSLLSPAAYGVH